MLCATSSKSKWPSSLMHVKRNLSKDDLTSLVVLRLTCCLHDFMSPACASLVALCGAGSDWALVGVTASEHAGSVSGAGAVGDWKSGCRIGVAGTVCGAVESISSAVDL